jgi:seryl-tRNA synthetase
MHDITKIRKNPKQFDEALGRRNLLPSAATILEADANYRSALTELETCRAKKATASKQIGMLIKQGDHERAGLLKDEVTELNHYIAGLKDKTDNLQRTAKELLQELPNTLDPTVPNGKDEKSNKVVTVWGAPKVFDFPVKDHADLGPALGMDFEAGAKISGTRFTFLKGKMAQLQRAIGQFMLDVQTTENGYMECNPPYLVNDDTMFGTGQLPKFKDDLYITQDGRWLIPTAEVSLTNLFRNEILEGETHRLTALTPCFRSEAGASGRDTRGFIRQHQFEKVELVTVCPPDKSEQEHEHMIASAELILQRLELPYRKVLLCAGDTGFSAAKTYDLEVWLPGQNCYREISSISNCGDFQARRMNIRYDTPEGKVMAHTLNGSGLAVGRTLVAILENYQNEDGSVNVPHELLPYMRGKTILTQTDI